jgi:MGT family glycosyltransferase
VTAGANTQVVRYVPHAEILPSASLVITHAGAGTTMAALGHGVPLLCMPMGRDQFFNAERVHILGAGRTLMPDADSDTIAKAATDVLADRRYTAEAKRTADVISGYGGAARAATALEALTRRAESRVADEDTDAPTPPSGD